MKILGIIPARFASSRFPGKPLIDIQGKTMIQRVYEGAKKSNLLFDLVVATDDQRIVDEVTRFGGKAMLTKSSHATGTDRCGEILSHFPEAEVVINIQGDEPLVDFRQLDALLSVFDDQNVMIATLATKKITQADILNPNRIKLVINAQNDALYFSRAPIPNTAHQGNHQDYPFLRHIGLYAYRATTLKTLTALTACHLEQTESLEQLRWMYYGHTIRIVETAIETPNIDAPEDLMAVLAELNKKE
jgi:3-deoxy-manno-octulosonate cytidylyltransferase (CMP-KDO synthetase)